MHRILEYQKTIVICENQFFLNHVEHFLNEKGVSNYANLNDLETLPYDIFSPHPEKLANRLETMAEIANKEKLIVLTTINSLIQPYFDKASINNFSYKFSQNDKLDREKLLNSLASAGYSSSEVVTERSEFAVRG